MSTPDTSSEFQRDRSQLEASLRESIEGALLLIAESVAKHVVQRDGWTPEDPCFRVDLREATKKILQIPMATIDELLRSVDSYRSFLAETMRSNMRELAQELAQELTQELNTVRSNMRELAQELNKGPELFRAAGETEPPPAPEDSFAVYSRPECIFHYCAYPAVCREQDRCVHPDSSHGIAEQDPQ